MASQPLGSLQARMSESDPRLYNVNRDVAHNFKDVMTRVFTRLQTRLWPELDEILANEGVSDAELGEAFNAICQFVGGAETHMRDEFQASLEATGWFKTPPAAQVAVMAMLGTVILGYHWAGVRESTLGNVGPALSLSDLRQAGEEMSKFLALPRWRRTWVLRWQRVRSAFRRLRGTE